MKEFPYSDVTESLQGREGGRGEGGREGGREGGEIGKEGEKEGERKGGIEGRREGGKEGLKQVLLTVLSSSLVSPPLSEGSCLYLSILTTQQQDHMTCHTKLTTPTSQERACC